MFKKMYVDRFVNRSLKVGGLKKCESHKTVNVYHEKFEPSPAEMYKQFFSGVDDASSGKDRKFFLEHAFASFSGWDFGVEFAGLCGDLHYPASYR
jgi:hypothetical protein